MSNEQEYEFVIWDDYTDELWTSFDSEDEADTYMKHGLIDEGQQPSNFSKIKKVKK